MSTCIDAVNICSIFAKELLNYGGMAAHASIMQWRPAIIVCR